MRNSNLINNQKKFMIYLSLFPEQGFINAVLVLFYLYHLNIHMSEYLILDSILFILTAFLEMPSGFISDYFGRKKILMLSQILMITSMIILLYANNFYSGLLSVIILSFGISLGSGNDISILYEFFSEYDSIENYEKILSNKNTLFFISTSVYSIASGFLFSHNMNLIIFLDILIMILNLTITYIYLFDKNSDGIKNLNMKSSKSTKFNYKNFNNVILAFLLVSLFFSFFRVTYNFYQPMYEEKHIPIELLGFFPLIYNVLASLGSQIYGKLFYKLSPNLKSIILLICLILSISLLFISEKYYLLLIVIFFQQIIRGIFFSYNVIAINNAIPENTKYRTTYISFYRMLTTLLGGILIFISSIISGSISLKSSYLIISLLILNFIIIILASMYFKKISCKIKCNSQDKKRDS